MKNKKTIIILVIVIIVILFLIQRCSTNNGSNDNVVPENSTEIENSEVVDEENGEGLTIDPNHPLNSGKEILYYLFNSGEDKIEGLIDDVGLSEDQVEGMKKIASDKHEKIQNIMDLKGDEFNSKLKEITDESNEKLKELFDEEEQFENFKNWIGDWWDNNSSELEVGNFTIDPNHPLNSGKEILYYLFNSGEDKIDGLIDDVGLSEDQVEGMKKIASDKHEKIQSIMDLKGDEFNSKLKEITDEGNEKLKGLFDEEDQFNEFNDWIGNWWDDQGSEIETGSKEFTDIPEDAYYKDALEWAVANGITDDLEGEEFKGDQEATRGEVVTFLWRAFGMEEPTISESPFEDVEEDAYYYKPVLWASEKGIAAGVSETEFAPEENVTRGQAATFQWRAAGKEEGATHSFTDIEEGMYYETPVAWASENNIAKGLTSTEYGPDENVTRGQMITFLYRQFND